MIYKHTFQVAAPLPDVAGFHSRSSSMAAITPPPIIVRVHQAPPVLADGDEMDFTLWLGPLPLRWLARIEDVTPTGFVDRQLRGPMGHWVHRHSFVPATATTTTVVDEVDVGLRPHLIWGPVGLGMALGLPVLFAYRGWKTRWLLQRTGRAPRPGAEQADAATVAPATALPGAEQADAATVAPATALPGAEPPGVATTPAAARPHVSSLALIGKAASLVALAGAAAVIGLARRRRSRPIPPPGTAPGP